MTEEQQALARRAVACKHWRWMPGMLAWSDLSDDPDVRLLDERLWWYVQAEEVSINEPNDPLPDLTDPATLGCLLALVREAWEDEWLSCKGEYSPTGSNWLVYSGKPHGRRFLTRIATTRYESESEALVAALEAAP